MYKPGELHHATVNGRAAIIYMTMDAVEMVDDDLIPRFRLGPREQTPHAMIPVGDTIVMGLPVRTQYPDISSLMKKDHTLAQ